MQQTVIVQSSDTDAEDLTDERDPAIFVIVLV